MQLYQKVQGQGAAAPAGTQKLAERDVVAVSLLTLTDQRLCCLDILCRHPSTRLQLTATQHYTCA